MGRGRKEGRCQKTRKAEFSEDKSDRSVVEVEAVEKVNNTRCAGNETMGVRKHVNVLKQERKGKMGCVWGK